MILSMSDRSKRSGSGTWKVRWFHLLIVSIILSSALRWFYAVVMWSLPQTRALAESRWGWLACLWPVHFAIQFLRASFGRRSPAIPFIKAFLFTDALPSPSAAAAADTRASSNHITAQQAIVVQPFRTPQPDPDIITVTTSPIRRAARTSLPARLEAVGPQPPPRNPARLSRDPPATHQPGTRYGPPGPPPGYPAPSPPNRRVSQTVKIGNGLL